VSRIPSAVKYRWSVIRTEQHLGVSKTPLLRIEVQEVGIFPIVADSTPITITKVSCYHPIALLFVIELLVFFG